MIQDTEYSNVGFFFQTSVGFGIAYMSNRLITLFLQIKQIKMPLNR